MTARGTIRARGRTIGFSGAAWLDHQWGDFERGVAASNWDWFSCRFDDRTELMLYRFREGDANMRSVWICSRNDAIGNLAVMLAAAGVFGTGTGWPDVIVAAIMGGLGLQGGWQIVRHARAELRQPATGLVAAE